ncbi:unnamed protein product [Acanthoscelides obtectus]|uniref:HAT C-terminal dimerisation domain-containing protein n=1 Tax=Acanthoscelides obtectus TaxID=200917 RepID=A0A9P0K4U3_ACAOB|nr:unnamed protein product [Acanthoscelides obtectus]CAK1631618.1 hypothetical protein AOBTE_LOCUS7051 [Acanthoscelides obtectus]
MINKIHNTDFFNILGDETMDVSDSEQLSLCLRYVDFTKDPNTPVLREDSDRLVPIDDQRSENLSNVILQRCKQLKLDMNKCVEQGYDRAADIAGHLSGIQKIIKNDSIILQGFANVSKADWLDNLAPYFDDKISSTAVKAEYRLWCAKISSIDQSTEVLKLLEYCNGNYFHGILLTTLATLPVTSASVERSFSTMKRIKTLPRSVIGHERLSSIAIISIHWDIAVDPDHVLDILSEKNLEDYFFDSTGQSFRVNGVMLRIFPHYIYTYR